MTKSTDREELTKALEEFKAKGGEIEQLEDEEDHTPWHRKTKYNYQPQSTPQSIGWMRLRQQRAKLRFSPKQTNYGKSLTIEWLRKKAKLNKAQRHERLTTT